MNPGSDRCQVCKLGEHSDEGARFCDQCQTGYFNASSNNYVVEGPAKYTMGDESKINCIKVRSKKARSEATS